MPLLLVRRRGVELLYLPAYSPDLNPYEPLFNKLKAEPLIGLGGLA